MKRSLLICLILAAMILLVVSILSINVVCESTNITVEPMQEPIIQFDQNADYMTLMAECASNGTREALEAGAAYEEQRNAKIVATGAAYQQTNFFSSTDPKTILKNIVKYNSMYLHEYNAVTYYSDNDVKMLAKVLYNECRGLSSITEQACVAWVVLNRADSDGASIKAVITSPNQFAYRNSTPVDKEMLNLAYDVLARWNAEKNGATYVGRVLPPDYKYFSGDGKHNYFRNAYKGNYSIWDYRLTSPYES